MRKNSQTSDLILLTLEKVVDGYARLEDFAYNTHIYAAGYQRVLKKNTLAQALKRLRQKGYIDLEKFNNRISYKLTQKGQLEANILKALMEPDSDRLTMVIFDIPEQNRKIRNILRGKLNLWGFEKVQKSVWVSKKDLVKPIRKFIVEIKLDKWVIIVEASSLFN